MTDSNEYFFFRAIKQKTKNKNDRILWMKFKCKYILMNKKTKKQNVIYFSL